MQFKIVVSDRDFNVIDEVQDVARNIRWSNNRIGGNGSFSFSIPARYCESRFLGGNFNIKIYRRNPSTDVFDLWYQGRIENDVDNVKGVSEQVTVRGSGYQSELKDIYVDKDYSNTAIEDVVDDIMDTFVTPNTNISKGTISATGFTADTLEFNTDALSAIQTCADIVGTREWGVDKDRSFTFQARSTSVGFRYPFGNKILEFSNDNTSNEIVNRVIVIGGDVAGSPFSEVYNDATSQLKWKRRDRAISNSAIVTTAVGTQFANAIFAELGDISRRARLKILDEILIEDTIPIPLVEVRPDLIRYGQEKYFTFLYSGLINYQVNRIDYQIDRSGSLVISMQLGQLRPSIAESINRLAFQLDQVRASTGV